MKHLFVYLMALISTSATFAQVRTFTSNGQTFTVDIAATINSYYDEYNKPNGLWGCIPCILEYAAEKEHLSKAQYLYGMSYMQGIDRDKDIKKGMMWLKKAADQGEKEAAGELGAYYDEFGQYVDAERYFLKALGAKFAYYNLGHHYMIQDNMELAEKYYKLAIDHGPKGQLMAIHNLNIIFARQMRIADMIVLLRKGSENYNDPYCQARLGELLYFYGSNCDERPSNKDMTEGKRWLEKAAADGDDHAKKVLSEIK